ncbi:hypothetical protein [Ammoniphilus sp. YIM 78166]|uniref:hypothetical protein n=1 Tax=Ammoniphilus sp. YIM 78166 TaxID=1644106 RepID=UPI00106FD216|nr:hypothetical protein [Ammoniphilus sp. YIM 78166]
MVTATIVILLILAIVSAAVWFSGMFNREEAIEPMRSDMQRLGHELRTEAAEEFHPNLAREGSDMQRVGQELRTEAAEEFHPNMTSDNSVLPAVQLQPNIVREATIQEQLQHIEATEREIQSDSFQAVQQQLQTASILLGQMNQTVQTIGVLMDMEHTLQQTQQLMKNQ